MARPTASGLKQLAAVIDQVSATPAYVGKQSRELEATVTKLVANASNQLSHAGSEKYRIDDLARITGVTTRNIRAYRERGLLPEAHRVGRVTLYSDAHVTRLELISSMLGRGYTIAHIDELLAAWQNGRQIADVLGLESELADQPTDATTTLAALAAAGVDAADAARLEDLGLVNIRTDDVLLTTPAIVDAILALVSDAQPASAVLDTVEQAAPAFDALRDALTAAASTLARSSAAPGTDGYVADVALSLIRLRTLADAATRAALAQTTNTLLTQLLSHVPQAQDDGDGPERADPAH